MSRPRSIQFFLSSVEQGEVTVWPLGLGSLHRVSQWKAGNILFNMYYSKKWDFRPFLGGGLGIVAQRKER